jgi:hypothetical protein
MGGLFGSSAPKPLPAPARPVTAVAKTPDIELADQGLDADRLKKKTGKRKLRVDIKDTSVQTGSSGSGLQIPTTGV